MGGWLREYGRPVVPTIRLACFPHAGGSASFFRPWAAHLPAHVQLLGVQYPGREDRLGLVPVTDLGEAAVQVARELAGCTDRPTLLFGHSLGAAVAFETARILERTYRITPAHLVVSGRPAPHLDRGGHVHEKGDEDLWAEVRALGGTDLDVIDTPGLRDLVLPALRADYAMSETYRSPPGWKLTCPVSAYLGDRDTEVTLREARAWAAHTRGLFAVQTFAGGHFYLITERAALVRSLLSACGTAAGWPSTP